MEKDEKVPAPRGSRWVEHEPHFFFSLASCGPGKSVLISEISGFFTAAMPSFFFFDLAEVSSTSDLSLADPFGQKL